jgi:hypothetical protein
MQLVKALLSTPPAFPHDLNQLVFLFLQAPEARQRHQPGWQQQQHPAALQGPALNAPSLPPRSKLHSSPWCAPHTELRV